MLIEGIAYWLDDELIGVYRPTLPGGNIFLEKLPQTPDTAIAIFVSGGPQASGTHGYDNPVTNIQVRGNRADPVGALQLAERVYAALQGLHHVILPGGVHVVSCIGIQSGPVRLGPDDSERFRYSLNFQWEIRNLTQNRE